MFNFDKKSDIPPASDAQPGSGGVSSAASDAHSQAAKDELSAKPKRKYTRRNAGDGSGDNRALQEQVNSAIAAQLEGVLAPEAWAALLCMPADAMRTWKGNERWKLSDEERKTVGITASAAARTMMITNPKGLAFFMAGSALFAMYMPRLMGELRDAAAKRNAAARGDAPKATTPEAPKA